MNFGFYLLRREHEIEISSPFWLINLSTFSKNVWYASLQNESTQTYYMYISVSLLWAIHGNIDTLAVYLITYEAISFINNNYLILHYMGILCFINVILLDIEFTLSVSLCLCLSPCVPCVFPDKVSQ